MWQILRPHGLPRAEEFAVSIHQENAEAPNLSKPSQTTTALDSEKFIRKD
jgi:hypothetical protein